jgi:hypothetical protein
MLTALVSIASILVPAISSVMPQWFGFLKAKSDAEYNVKIAEIQLETAKAAANANLNIEELKAHTEEIVAETKETSHPWIDASKSLIRPLITYVLFFFYIGIKVAFFIKILYLPGADTLSAIVSLFTTYDELLLTMVLSYWFSSRLVDKFQAGSSLMKLPIVTAKKKN